MPLCSLSALSPCSFLSVFFPIFYGLSLFALFCVFLKLPPKCGVVVAVYFKVIRPLFWDWKINKNQSTLFLPKNMAMNTNPFYIETIRRWIMMIKKQSIFWIKEIAPKQSRRTIALYSADKIRSKARDPMISKRVHTLNWDGPWSKMKTANIRQPLPRSVHRVSAFKMLQTQWHRAVNLSTFKSSEIDHILSWSQITRIVDDFGSDLKTKWFWAFSNSENIYIFQGIFAVNLLEREWVRKLQTLQIQCIELRPVAAAESRWWTDCGRRRPSWSPPPRWTQSASPGVGPSAVPPPSFALCARRWALSPIASAS